MPYIIRGKICGLLCDECSEPLTHARIRLYRVSDLRAAALETGAETKETLRLLTDKEVEARSNLLLAEAELDNAGEFKALIPEKADYQGEALAVALEILRAPGQEEAPRRSLPVHVTIWQPSWRQTPAEATAIFEYCLPWRFWCYLRGLLDAWVICGRVLDCQTKRPLGNVRVVAFDEDWIQDDRVGEAITDLDGRFRIHYRSRDFKQTFLSPIGINIETPFPPYNSGPDLYFRVETLARTPLVLLEEAPARGRAADRSNVGPCFCVTLCAELLPGDPESVPGVWTSIGSAFTIPDASSLNSFDAQGYAGAGKNALFGTIRLTGSAPRISNGFPVEYRFRAALSSRLNTAAALPESSFTHIVGVSPGLYAPVRLGRMFRFSPYRIVDVESDPSDFDAEGWLSVQQAIERTFLGLGLSAELSTPGLWTWVDDDALMGMNTQIFSALLPESPTPAEGAVAAGAPLPAGSLMGPAGAIALRFEIREVVNKPAGLFNVMPGSGWTVNALKINNQAPFAKLAVAEHSSAGSCSPLTSAHMAYTVQHPLIQALSLNVRSNDGSFNRYLSDPSPASPQPTDLPIAGNTNDSVNHRYNPMLPINGNPGAGGQLMHTCTYLATLALTLRLHNGDFAWGTTYPQTTFYYQA